MKGPEICDQGYTVLAEMIEALDAKPTLAEVIHWHLVPAELLLAS
jgi:hypothetical protein